MKCLGEIGVGIFAKHDIPIGTELSTGDDSMQKNEYCDTESEVDRFQGDSPLRKKKLKDDDILKEQGQQHGFALLSVGCFLEPKQDLPKSA